MRLLLAILILSLSCSAAEKEYPLTLNVTETSSSERVSGNANNRRRLSTWVPFVRFLDFSKEWTYQICDSSAMLPRDAMDSTTCTSWTFGR
jgi:hypothetical protein